MLRFERSLIRVLVIMSFLIGTGKAISAEEVWETNGGSFNVWYSSKLVPIPINQIHQWVLHIESAEGEPISDASLELVGGMPLHDHGLPTIPSATEYLGEGNYLIEGMRFHMMGDWEITVEISQGDLSETVLIPLRV